MDRTILHCDCNSFFASVETVLDPRLADVPMAVCGDPESRHGIILAKNEHAKKFGVQTAETIYQAVRKCPDLILVIPHHGLYEEFSRRANQIYQSYTDLVEPFGIDESWLDVTGSRLLFGDGKTIADNIRSRFRKELGITCSVGVSFNKTMAKLGSDYKKPDATTVITRENFQQLVWPLPVNTLLFVGRNIQKELEHMYIFTIGDLAGTPRSALIRRFGKAGEALHDSANGLDNAPVESAYTETPPKSIGNGFTFRRDLVNEEDIRSGILWITETLTARMRNYHVKCSTLHVSVKYSDFTTSGRQKKLDFTTNLTREIADESLRILFSFYHFEKAIRSLTITGSQLEIDSCTAVQTCLFDNGAQKHQKQERIEDAVARIRNKYGTDSVTLGRTLLETDIK